MYVQLHYHSHFIIWSPFLWPCISLSFNVFVVVVVNWRVMALQYRVGLCHIHQRESATGIHMSPPALLKPSLFPPYRLSQSTGLNSLCHPANSFLLSVLHMVMYMFPCHSQIHPTLSLSNCICNRLSLYEDYCKICTNIQINTLLPLFLASLLPYYTSILYFSSPEMFIILSSLFSIFLLFRPSPGRLIFSSSFILCLQSLFFLCLCVWRGRPISLGNSVTKSASDLCMTATVCQQHGEFLLV